MTERKCPVPDCTKLLGTTKRGDPWLMCRGHWSRVPVDLQWKMWRAYRAWQRLERQWLNLLPPMRPPALAAARASSVQAYIDVRDDCIRKASDGESQQMEVAL